ncbi:MAG: OprO/OprP family phosphate-selective porin [Planctomycetaceae bacterium]
MIIRRLFWIIPVLALSTCITLRAEQPAGTYNLNSDLPFADADPPAPRVLDDSLSYDLLLQRLQQAEQRLEELESDKKSPASLVLPMKGLAEEKPAEAEDKSEEDQTTFKTSWKNGLEWERKDKAFRLHVGGRTQVDSVWLSAEPGALVNAGGVGEQDAVDFRRARLRVDGTMYEVIDWVAEYDFVNNVNENAGLAAPFGTATENNVIHVPAPTDLWWNIKELPFVGNFRIGNFKEPLGLEHNTSSRFLDFMERSYNQDLFTGPFNNGFSPGMMFWNTMDEEHGTWAVGVFKNTQNIFEYNTGDGEYAATGRLTYLPYYEDEGEKLFHLGVSGSYRGNDQNRMRFRSRASLRNGPGALNPVMADTGFFTSNDQGILGGEVAMIYGSLHLQAEYMGSWVTDSVGNAAPFLGVPLGTVFVHGYYAQALYFLTGEHREYEKKAGSFGRVVPHNNALWREKDCTRTWCPGAWQVGARYGSTSLNDFGMDGGTSHDVTVGLNWFLNPNMKVQWNYVFTHRDAPRSIAGGDIEGFGMRVAHDF